MRRLLIALTISLTLGATTQALAATSYNELEQQVMCVDCNVPLNIAESPQANAEKRQLRALVDQGLSKQQVLDRMVAIYGDNVLAKPKGSGFNLVAWIVPIGVVLGLIALGLVLLPRWRARNRASTPPGTDPSEPPLDPAEARRLDEDMSRLGV